MFAILGCAFILGCIIALIVAPIKSLRNSPKENYDAAFKEYMRVSDLHDRKMATKEEYDQACSNFHKAQDEYMAWLPKRLTKKRFL